MRACGVFDSPRHLSFPLLAVCLLSYRPVFPPGHQLLLPRWWTHPLCTSADEDLGTLAEYDPLTDVPGDVEVNQQNGRGPGRSRTDVTVCVCGRIEFDEKASAAASHKKFRDKKLPESRAKKKNGPA